MKKILSFFAKEVFYNGHIQSLGASGVAYLAARVLLNEKSSFDLIVVVYLTFQYIYFYDRSKDLDKDRITNPERSIHLERYINKSGLVLVVLGVGAASSAIYFSGIPAMLFAITVILLGFMYPIYFKKLTRLIPVFKDLYVSFVYLLLTFFVLIYFSSAITFNLDLFVTALFVFVEMLLTQLLLDFKDYLVDKKNKLKTLPVMVGKKKALLYMKVLSVSMASVFVFIVASQGLHRLLFPLIILCLFINLYTLYKIDRNETGGYLASSGKFAAWLLFALLF